MPTPSARTISAPIRSPYPRERVEDDTPAEGRFVEATGSAVIGEAFVSVA
jgi:hypothetical protein